MRIPEQEIKLKSYEHYFVLKLKERKNVAIELSPGIAFMFSGKLLTHMQSCTKVFSYND